MDPAKLTENEFNCLKTFIEQNCGIALNEYKLYLVESRLAHLLVENDCSDFRELCFKVKNDSSSELRNKIVDAMTTNETSWFRDTSPYLILEELLLKRYFKEIEEGRRKKLRIWSTACSTGQEPYSIAITIQEYYRKKRLSYMDNVEILATDISPTVLFLAKAGRYDQIAISRGLSAELKNRYFIEDGRTWKLTDSIKKMVVLERFNLKESFLFFGRFDVIFCRYVAIYFSNAFKRDLFNRLHSALRPHDGYLFLGASESMSLYNTDYEMLSHDGHIYYRVKE